MKLDEFFEELELLPVQWKERRVFHESFIRCRPFSNFPQIECCPLTAMAWFKTGKIFVTDQTYMAAWELDLSDDDAKCIVVSSDEKNSLMRSRIMQACRLSRGLLPEKTQGTEP